MKMYSIIKTSSILNISKYTLRYYDKLGLVSPTRKENKYRLYSEKDLLDLKYIGVMKFAGFSLLEIKKILHNKNNISPSIECKNDTLSLLNYKHTQTLNKIKQLQRIADLINISIDTVNGKEIHDFDTVNHLILDIYSCIDNNKNEENIYE